jgi:glyoxylase-like metal-dependent hydrolase (beta-lactamase superfamily II)
MMNDTATVTATHDLATPGLHPSPPETLPFAPSLAVRAFLLERDDGDILVYNNTAVPDWIEGFGPPSRHYLNHGHEAMFPAVLSETALFVHRADADAVGFTMHVRATFSRRHTLDDDFEVIPTPGHTPGATAYLWNGAGRRYLFTGDTIYLDGGEWRGAVLGSSDRAAYLESLGLLRELDFDVLVPWAATRGDPYVAPTDHVDARRRIGEIIERVRDGRNG